MWCRHKLTRRIHKGIKIHRLHFHRKQALNRETRSSLFLKCELQSLRDGHTYTRIKKWKSSFFSHFWPFRPHTNSFRSLKMDLSETSPRLKMFRKRVDGELLARDGRARALISIVWFQSVRRYLLCLHDAILGNGRRGQNSAPWLFTCLHINVQLLLHLYWETGVRKHCEGYWYVTWYVTAVF